MFLWLQVLWILYSLKWFKKPAQSIVLSGDLYLAVEKTADLGWPEEICSEVQFRIYLHAL